MQELIAMISLSLLLSLAAFADVAPRRDPPTGTDATLSSVPRGQPVRPFVPRSGTATFTATNTAVSTAISTHTNVKTTILAPSVPPPPPKMPEEPTKPTGFK